MNETERSYIAFISYRHLPLDKKVAERIQKKIENYKIPKEYQEKFGAKKLGHVFRDEDELPASSSLTDSIYYALDHSEYLIVICTPGLPKSKWCEAEIRYFLKTHGRDRILAVLADGEPEESFSPYLLHEFDEEGNPVSNIEPLAANIAGENHTVHQKVFNKETTRLCAAMIGCPFDSLWQREKRARMNRLLTAAGAAMAVMAVFLGVILNRNAQIAAQSVQIREQNDQLIQKNEEIQGQNDRILEQNEKIDEQNRTLAAQLSSVLVDSGIQKLEDHDKTGALKDALAALDTDDPDTCDPRAEKLLADALGAYKTGQLQSSLVYEQTTDISEIKVTADERFAILKDAVGTVRCLDLSTYEVVWEYLVADADAGIYILESSDSVVVKTSEGVFALSAGDGSVLWSFEQDSPNYFQCISDDGSLFALLDTRAGEPGTQSSEDNSDEMDLFRPVYVVFLNTATGQETGRTQLTYEHYGVRQITDTWKAENYGTDFSSDNRYFCCSLYFDVYDNEAEYPFCEPCFAIDTETFEAENVGALQKSDEDHYLLSDIFFGCDISDNAEKIIFTQYGLSSQNFDIRVCDKTDDGYERSVAHQYFTYHFTALMEDDYNQIQKYAVPALTSENHMVLFMDSTLVIFDKKTNEIQRSYTMDDRIRLAYWNDPQEEIMEVITADGTVLTASLSTREGKTFDAYGFLMLDQSDLYLAVPGKGGVVQNKMDGYCLTVQKVSAGKLYRTQYISDPSAKTVFGEDVSFDRMETAMDLLPDTGMIFLGNQNSSFAYAVTFDRETGECKDDKNISKRFSAFPFFAIDEKRFLQEDNLLYSMEDGSVSPYLEFKELEGTDTYAWDLYEMIRLSDGRMMACSIGVFLADEGIVYYYPLWLDGEFYDHTGRILDPDFSESFTGVIPKLGKAGLMMVYGKDIQAEDPAKNQFVVRSVNTGKTYYMESDYPEAQDFIPALATQTEQMAVLYGNGRLFLYHLSEGESEEIRMDAGAFGAQNESIALCFSDGDDYLGSLTTAGLIRILDLNTREVHTFSSDLIRSFCEGKEESIRSLFNYYSYLRINMSEDKKTMYVFAGIESGVCQLLIIDTETWTIREEGENTLLLDPDYNRIYAYTDNWDGNGHSGVVSYSVHDLEDLKQWAKEELGEQAEG